MSFSFLDEDNIFTKYTESKQYTDLLTKPFPEFERIARNRPHDSINSKYPRVTDGTTSAIIRKTSRRVIQQVPTGVVESDTEEWLPIVADFIYRTIILANANEDYDLIQKCWTALERSLTFGSVASYAPFLSHDGVFSPDMDIPFWGDIYLQQGKKSGYACKYLFMRAWYQKSDIEQIIDRENKFKADAKTSGDKYEATWDVASLKQILDKKSAKEDHNKQPFEKDRNVNADGIELVTGFQVGKGATFYVFNPSEKLIVRRKKNKDPRGKIPIDWLYAETDGANPLGRGIVELVGGLQNMIDSGMQMYHWNRALMIDPPMRKIGNYNKNAIAFSPGKVNDLGNDPNNKLEIMTVDSTAVQNYPSLYGLEKSQLLNIVSSPDTSISAEVGNPGFGKTPTALNQQKATISVDDNYIRKMFEAWFQNWSETAINLFFAERTGIGVVKLDDDTVNKLKALAEESKFDMSLINDKSEIMIDYDSETPTLKFRVDASTSKLQDEASQRESLSTLITAIDSSPTLQQIMGQYPDKMMALWNRLVSNASVEDPEDLKIDIKEVEQIQAQQQAIQQQQVMQTQAQPQVAPQAPQMAPQEPMTQEQPMGLDDALRTKMAQLGFGPMSIQSAIDQANMGEAPETILAGLRVDG